MKKLSIIETCYIDEFVYKYRMSTTKKNFLDDMISDFICQFELKLLGRSFLANHEEYYIDIRSDKYGVRRITIIGQFTQDLMLKQIENIDYDVLMSIFTKLLKAIEAFYEVSFEELISMGFVKTTFKDISLAEAAFALRPYEAGISVNIKKVIFNKPKTIVLWEDGTKTIVTAEKRDKFDKEKGLAMAIAKKALGNNGNYYDIFKEYINKEE